MTSYLLVGIILCLRELSRRKRTPRGASTAAATPHPTDPAGRRPAQPRGEHR